MPVVSGNSISWPADGWYQVQSATTYESLCEGGSSCTAPAPGLYTVINLTTGQRFERITVGGGSAGIPDRGISVDGNTISWPNDGSYEY